jgi:hypothetical protein
LICEAGVGFAKLQILADVNQLVTFVETITPAHAAVCILFPLEAKEGR